MPIPAVALHMVLSAVVIWAATRVVSFSVYLAQPEHAHAAPVDLGEKNDAAAQPVG